MSCEFTPNPLKLIRCPFLVTIFVASISVASLIAAFASEAFLNLEPCILCIYQRWPYALVILFSVLGLLIKSQLLRPMLALSGLSFLVNSGIAFYHTGVEQKWWQSAVEGCKVDFAALTGEKSTQSMLENIMSAPTGNCAEIPWSDPILGLSMANYNVVLCLGLAAICFASFILSKKHP